jgi:hypothetical protein
MPVFLSSTQQADGGTPLAYSTGAELAESIVLDSALCTANADCQKRYRYGTPLGQITASRNHSYWDLAAVDGRATLTGILVRTVDVTRGDMPGAQYTAFATFETTRLLNYTGNEAQFAAALPTCNFRTLTKRNPSP